MARTYPRNGLRVSWLDEDPGVRMAAEVIASGIAWNGSLSGKGLYCPPRGLKGGQVMTALEQFLKDRPDIAEKSYGDAMAASLTRALPARRNRRALAIESDLSVPGNLTSTLKHHCEIDWVILPPGLRF
jgi:hypothetical protein